MNRKKLSDAEQAFVTGGGVSQPQNKRPKNRGGEGDAISKILAPPDTGKETMTRFTADLPDSLHERLSLAALKAKKSKVQLVREILDAVLEP